MIKEFYLLIPEKSETAFIEKAIQKGIQNFIIWDNITFSKIGQEKYFFISNERVSNEARIANSIADCMNAEQDKVTIILWDSNDFETLESLIPIKAPYGWMILSNNVDIIINAKNVQPDSEIGNIDHKGYYSDDLDALISIKNSTDSVSSD